MIDFVSVERLAVNKVMEELDKTNQRLDEVQTVSIEEIEERLTKQVNTENNKNMNFMINLFFAVFYNEIFSLMKSFTI